MTLKKLKQHEDKTQSGKKDENDNHIDEQKRKIRKILAGGVMIGESGLAGG